MSKQAAQPADEGAGEAGENSGPPSAVAPDDLKSLLPASLPGGFPHARITLSATDMGAMGALAALGSALGANASQETATTYSKLGQVDGRMTMDGSIERQKPANLRSLSKTGS
jgi:hypothetical protein